MQSTGYVRVAEFTKDVAEPVDAGGRRADQDGRHQASSSICAAPPLATSTTASPRRGCSCRAERCRSARPRPSAKRSAQRRTTARSERPSSCSSTRARLRAAEIFAAALDGNDRAELVGERTLGRAARQQLVKLPDGSGLLLSSMRYLTPANAGIHERGLTPDVEVRQPDVEFGAQPPAKDETLDTALTRLAEKKAA